jgi:hypothetical protein
MAVLAQGALCEVHINRLKYSDKSQACEIHMLMKKTSQTGHRNFVGRRIKRARMRCKPPVSQEDLAGRLAGRGVSMDQTAISRIENQSRYLMDYEIAAIARALKVSVAWLFGEEN